jgi:hypothetical protein
MERLSSMTGLPMNRSTTTGVRLVNGDQQGLAAAFRRRERRRA